MTLRTGTVPAPTPSVEAAFQTESRLLPLGFRWLESPISPKGKCFQIFLIHWFCILATMPFDMPNVLVVITLIVLKITFKTVELNLIIIEKSTEKINNNKNITKLLHRNIGIINILTYFHLSSWILFVYIYIAMIMLHI